MLRRPAKSLSQMSGSIVERINTGLLHVLDRYVSPESRRVVDMLKYSLGFLDIDFLPNPHVDGGKRIRSSLCLLVAEGYGAYDATLDAALSIELFHNFTLIHDDIEDHDEMRRNKPTLWKLVGVNHAINAGDMLSLIACGLALETSEPVSQALLGAFREVIEGQYLDFASPSSPIATDPMNSKQYERMIDKKTGALFGIAAEAAGIAAGRDANECRELRTFGRQFGTTFQIADDYASVWSSKESTGKDAHSDIRERKRNLPFLIVLKNTNSPQRLAELYDLERPLSEAEIDEVRRIFDVTGARALVRARIHESVDTACAIVDTLGIANSTKKILKELVQILITQ